VINFKILNIILSKGSSKAQLKQRQFQVYAMR